ncbi:unnamed protein product, partial [Strongylus vulgaris]
EKQIVVLRWVLFDGPVTSGQELKQSDVVLTAVDDSDGFLMQRTESKDSQGEVIGSHANRRDVQQIVFCGVFVMKSSPQMYYQDNNALSPLGNPSSTQTFSFDDDDFTPSQQMKCEIYRCVQARGYCSDVDCASMGFKTYIDSSREREENCRSDNDCHLYLEEICWNSNSDLFPIPNSYNITVCEVAADNGEELPLTPPGPQPGIVDKKTIQEKVISVDNREELPLADPQDPGIVDKKTIQEKIISVDNCEELPLAPAGPQDPDIVDKKTIQ